MYKSYLRNHFQLQFEKLEELLKRLKNKNINICVETANCSALIFVGAPLVVNQQYYSCAVAILNGEVVAITPNQKVASKSLKFIRNCDMLSINRRVKNGF